jgi:hypothetical protein
MQAKYVKFGAGLALAALLGAACGSDDSEPATTGEPAPETTVDDSADNGDDANGDATDTSVDTGAADVRATLTAQLQEHVYLAGTAIATAVGDGGDLEAPATASAVATLDENSVALSETVASVYGEAGGEQFLALWRDHIGFFVEYTLAGAGGDAEGQEQARADLDGYRAEFGAFIEGATEGGLPADAVAEELVVHVESVFDTIDAVLEGSPDVYPLLKEAAGHMPGTANVLAGAIVDQFPDMFDGSVDSQGSEVRTVLTAQLQEHVYLAGLAINQAVADGGDLEAPATASAVETLDSNSQDLADTVASVYGDDAGEQFLALWRDHIGFFVEYTLAGAGGDAEGQEQARADLDGYRAEFGAFIEGATEGRLPANAVAEELTVHVETVFDTIDAVLEGSPEVFPRLREAASHMPGTAQVLAGGILG